MGAGQHVEQSALARFSRELAAEEAGRPAGRQGNQDIKDDIHCHTLACW
jgi:hypothetical protein